MAFGVRRDEAGDGEPADQAIVKAITTRDLLLVQGGVLVVAIAYLLFNLLADVLQSLLDPRLRR